MSAANGAKMQVPGVTLYFQMRGTGPLLLMIPAGVGDAGSFDGVADHLARNHTVVTYDRRGYSRSRPDQPMAESAIPTHADDAYHLLTALGALPATPGGPAFVFGSSIGALIGLDLVARYPGCVRTLVSHEPPTRRLLPDGDQIHLDMLERYRTEGPFAAIRTFAAAIGVDSGERGADADIESISSPWAAGNAEVFLTQDVPAAARYSPDIDALRAVADRIVLAAGTASRGYWPYRCTTALADLLGTEPVEFPGHHAGFVDRPREFADLLTEVLARKSREAPQERWKRKGAQ